MKPFYSDLLNKWNNVKNLGRTISQEKCSDGVLFY